MEIKIGDRYRRLGENNPSYLGYIIEIIDSKGGCVVIEGLAQGEWYGIKPKRSLDNWIYLGNFAKSENLTNLYQILSND